MATSFADYRAEQIAPKPGFGNRQTVENWGWIRTTWTLKTTALGAQLGKKREIVAGD